MSRQITVLYFISEDGDTESLPNSFSFSVNRQQDEVSLRDLRQKFPVPGAYHFRAKRSFKGGFVWEDLVDDSQLVSVDTGVLRLKVSRIKLLNRFRASSTEASLKKQIRIPTRTSTENLLAMRSKVESKGSKLDLLGFDEFHQPSSSNLDLFCSFDEQDDHGSKDHFLDALDWSTKVNLSSPTASQDGNGSDLNHEHKAIASPETQASWNRFVNDHKMSLQSIANDFEIC